MPSAVMQYINPSVPLSLEVENEGKREQRNFRLCFDFNALALAEQETGFTLMVGRIFKYPTALNLRALLWAALQLYHADEFAGKSGLQLVGSMLTLRNSAAATEAVAEAYLINLPDEQQEKIRKAREEEADPKELKQPQ